VLSWKTSLTGLEIGLVNAFVKVCLLGDLLGTSSLLVEEALV
jgi:hypothetical protein